MMPAHRKRFCVRGHDTQANGRYPSGGCKVCVNARAKARNAIHPEKSQAYQRAWRQAHVEYIQAWGKAYRERQGVKKRRREWNVANRERINAVGAAWRRAHPEKSSAYSATWRRAHLDKDRAYAARKRQRKIGITPQVAEAVRDYYGPACIYCGGEAGGFDHLQPISRGGASDLLNLAPCCKKCNTRKGNRPIWVMLYPRNNPYSPEFVAPQKEKISCGH